VYDYDDAAFLEDNTHGGHTFLGNLTVTGAGTYTMPTSSFSNATLRTAGLTGGAMEVRLVGVSGTVDVSQVKLRVWPVGGPLGDWSSDYTQPATSAPLTLMQQALGGGGGTYTDQASFRAALATVATVGAATPESDDQINGASMAVIYNALNDTTQVSGGPGLGYFKVTTGEYAPPGTEGVDWIRAPEEVEQDYLRLVDAPDDGTISWTQPVASALNSSNAVATSGDYYFCEGSAHLSVAAVDEPLPSGTNIYGLLGSGTPVQSYPGHGISAVQTYTEDATLPDGLAAEQWYRLLMWHDGHLADVAVPMRDADTGGGSTSVTLLRGDQGATLDPLAANWQPSPYRYWVPGPAVNRRPLRQWPLEQGDGGSPRRYSRDALSSYGSGAPRRYGAGYQ
jgi:hypothetical protein